VRQLWLFASLLALFVGETDSLHFVWTGVGFVHILRTNESPVETTGGRTERCKTGM
jgi:hypothetical protein